METQGGGNAGVVGRPVRPLRADTRLAIRPDLPARQTSFVGRALELAELAELLAAPNCRLLTLIGPGGIGKTRLAIEAAAAARETFADGVAFAPLQAVLAADALAPAIAAAIGCPLNRQEDGRAQVARYLHSSRLLLVLDNFEHLIEEADWLSELLDAAPGLCLLVTSREALNLREEWRYPLAGLAVPTEDADAPEQAEAVRLFIERAQQVRRDFSLAAEREGVLRLCRSTEGLPLALELAAAWIKTLPCAAIADEIERNIAFLATDLRNVPARHRSMRAAFDYSWALLTDYERHIFRRLAVFRGGFSRQAAESVAGATLPLLSSLVDKSLVRYDADGRFHMHELLRQYADEQLQLAPLEAAHTYDAHRQFYLDFVAARRGPIAGGAQIEAVASIAAELDNIRAAWGRAVAACDGAALAPVAHPLALFYDFRARYREGLSLMEEGLRVLRAAPPSPANERAIAAILVDVVRFYHRLGQLAAMRAVLAESEERYARLNIPPPPGHMTDPRVWRGILALIDGHYDEGDAISAEAIRSNAEANGQGNLPAAWWVQSMTALWREEIALAGEHARRSAEAAIAAGDDWHLAYANNLQGHIATASGDYASAREHYELSYALREAFDDPEGVGTSLVHLGKVATLQGFPEEGEEFYQRSLTIARQIGDRVTMAFALNGLGLTACTLGEYGTAGWHFAEGLRQMIGAPYMRILLTLLASSGDWLLQTGRAEEAAGLLLFVRDHPATDIDTRARIRHPLASVEALLAPAAFAAAAERHRGADATDLATRLLPILTAPPAAEPASPARAAAAAQAAPVTPTTPPPPTPPSALTEPLTARELAVLRAIATGRSNREIADDLFLAVNTVRSYSQQLYGKLGVSSRTQAIARAREFGLLD